MKYKHVEGATHLDLNEIKDLIPMHLATQEELNAWEENNIVQAQKWALTQKNIISIAFAKDLHRRMFNKTWRWAGSFRTSEKNLGIHWYAITTELKKLCDDVQYQLAQGSFSDDEIALRFHHRLVYIHAFPNGNGRHARLMADLFIMQLGHTPFTWGSRKDLMHSSSTRLEYISSLKLADSGHYGKLLSFARS
jgi:Fic-DOC domain mobile mystery protein B